MPPAPRSAGRLRREAATLRAMIMLYCAHHHAPSRGAPCDECRDLLDYALRRLHACPFGAEKPVCSKCPVHCYSSRRRDQIRAVMRYAGPRMLKAHPWLALAHLWDRRRAAPAAPPTPSRASAADATLRPVRAAPPVADGRTRHDGWPASEPPT